MQALVSSASQQRRENLFGRKEIHDVNPPNPDNQCRKCRNSRRRLNSKKFCKRDYAVVVQILSREKEGDNWVKFAISVLSVMKRTQMNIHRGRSVMWISRKDLACKCPNIRLGPRYVLLGNSAGGNENGYIINSRSIMIRWKKRWHRRIRKFIRHERRRKC
ncbi:netrin-1-like isoform X1 [Argonauta hians]